MLTNELAAEEGPERHKEIFGVLFRGFLGVREAAVHGQAAGAEGDVLYVIALTRDP